VFSEAAACGAGSSRGRRSGDTMEKHNLTQLENKFKELQSIFTELSSNTETNELLKIIHRPGWTTPAEFSFVNALTDSLITQTRNVITLRKTLLNTAQQVEMGQPVAV
jgi:hypothetical protein